jgi:hypothetical protein
MIKVSNGHHGDFIPGTIIVIPDKDISIVATTVDTTTHPYVYFKNPRGGYSSGRFISFLGDDIDGVIDAIEELENDKI